jgi:predicted DNA-binding WGR domain protein
LQKKLADEYREILKRGDGSSDLAAKAKADFGKVKQLYEDLFKNTKPNTGTIASLDPGKDKDTAATDALTQAKYRLAAAEGAYKQELETTKLLEDSGQITHAQAEERNTQARRDYIAELERIKATLPGVIAQLEAMGSKGAKGAAEARIELQKLTNEVIKTQTEQANSTFFGQMRAQIRSLANEWGNVGKQIGTFLTQQFQNFANTAGQMISNLIFRTGNWKQSLLQLGQAFVTQLATMVIQFIISQTVMRALNAAFGKADAQQSNKLAAQSAGAWSVAAISASIATEGVAAGTGLAAYLAAAGIGAAAAVGISAAAGGYQGGGFTGHGPEHKKAGDVHFEEVVFPADRVRYWGKDMLVNMAIGSLTKPSYQRGGWTGGSSSGSGSPRAADDKVNVHIAMFDNRQALADWLRSREGQKIVIDTVSGRRIELGI